VFAFALADAAAASSLLLLLLLLLLLRAAAAGCCWRLLALGCQLLQLKLFRLLCRDQLL